MEVAFRIHMDLEVLFVKSGRGKFDVVLLLTFDYVDGGSRVGRSLHPAVVEEIIEDIRQPAIGSSSDR